MFGIHTRQWYLDQQTAMEANHARDVRNITNQLMLSVSEKEASAAEARKLREILDNQTLENRRIALAHAVDVTPGADPSVVLKAAGLFDTYLKRGSTLPVSGNSLPSCPIRDNPQA